jgi:hypothetical protein
MVTPTVRVGLPDHSDSRSPSLPLLRSLPRHLLDVFACRPGRLVELVRLVRPVVRPTRGCVVIFRTPRGCSPACGRSSANLSTRLRTPLSFSSLEAPRCHGRLVSLYLLRSPCSSLTRGTRGRTLLRWSASSTTVSAAHLHLYPVSPDMFLPLLPILTRSPVIFVFRS